MTPDDRTGVEDVIEQLGERCSDAIATIELLLGYQQLIEEQRGALENPPAVLEYLAFFTEFIRHAAADCDRIAGELHTGVHSRHVSTLRQLAADSAAEQGRCLRFRDACISRALPFEKMRPLLNEISISTRDQLTAFRDFVRAADRLERLMPPSGPEPPSRRSFDRRALFTKLLKRDTPDV